MRNSRKKIFRLLSRFDDVFSECVEGNHKKGKRSERKLEKKLDRAESFVRKALSLCREDIAKGASDGREELVNCVFRLSDLFIRREREEEAEKLLSEIYDQRKTYGASVLLTECMGHYGSILCGRGMYDLAAAVLDEMLTRVNNEVSHGVFPENIVPDDAFAVCRGLSSAACAFTYADTGEGFAPERFTLPFELLGKISGHGVEVAEEYVKKAAYFAASQQLFVTCYETVPGADVSRAVEYAEQCLDACSPEGENDLYLPAAMRLTALALARDCKFADAAEMCRLTLERCAAYRGEVTKADFGSIQSIAGDMNLLLGILHYRASEIGECIRYFEAAIASFEADAQGAPLRDAGYAEAETEIIFLSDAEKCAFACKYIGLAKFSEKERYPLDECLQVMRRGVELLETADPDEPYFLLASSAEYHIISQMCERAGDAESAKKFDEISKSRGYDALHDLSGRLSSKDRLAGYYERVRCRRRMAMRLGLLELYGDYTRFEILLSEPPYSQPDHRHLARLHFDMGEYCRAVGRNESAVEYFHEVRKHSFDGDGKPYYEMSEGNIFEFSLIASASCLTKCGQQAKARRVFREYADLHREDGVAGKTMRVRIAGLSREVGLDPEECAGYMHDAAVAVESEDGCSPVAAELYNQEGICWYNASPMTDPEDPQQPDSGDVARLEEMYADRERKAFENAIRVLVKCDGSSEKVMDLMPSLYSNTGECYLRLEEFDTALGHYNDAVAAFERLFAAGFFTSKPKS